MFVKVDADIRHGLGQLVSNDTADHASTKSDSLLGGAMARTLCFIHRVQREIGINHKLKPRILVVSGSCDSALPYMTSMNAIFAAKKRYCDEFKMS